MSEDEKMLTALTGATAKWVHFERAWRIGQDPKDGDAMVRARNRVVEILDEYDRSDR
jgi:hypothetical protein